MAAYLFVRTRVLNPYAWSDYRGRVEGVAAQYGGCCLVRGAKGEVLEGSSEGRSLVVFEFPSIQAIHDFWTSPGYLGLKKLREGAVELDVWALPGVQKGS